MIMLFWQKTTIQRISWVFFNKIYFSENTYHYSLITLDYYKCWITDASVKAVRISKESILSKKNYHYFLYPAFRWRLLWKTSQVRKKRYRFSMRNMFYVRFSSVWNILRFAYLIQTEFWKANITRLVRPKKD